MKSAWRAAASLVSFRDFRRAFTFSPLAPLARALLFRLYSRFLKGQRGHIPILKTLMSSQNDVHALYCYVRALACTMSRKKKKKERRKARGRMTCLKGMLHWRTRRDETQVDALANLSKTYLSISFPLKVQGFNLQIWIFSRYLTGIINRESRVSNVNMHK